MSIELRLRCNRPDNCTQGKLYPTGFDEDHCTHRFECDWGVFDNPEADVSRGLSLLMLITPDYVRYLLHNGPQSSFRGGPGIISASIDGERIFIHLDHGSGRTTWELFDAHWEDGGPPEIYVGRWPD